LKKKKGGSIIFQGETAVGESMLKIVPGKGGVQKGKDYLLGGSSQAW